MCDVKKEVVNLTVLDAKSKCYIIVRGKKESYYR